MASPPKQRCPRELPKRAVLPCRAHQIVAAPILAKKPSFSLCRIEELSKADARLQAANAGLEDFAHSVVHDLRAPLRDAGQKMEQVIEDILAISRASRASLDIARQDMTALVQDVWGQLQPTFAGRKIRLKLGDLPPAYGDRPMLRRVWQNLLDNAIKYTGLRDHAVIEVGAKASAEETAFAVRGLR